MKQCGCKLMNNVYAHTNVRMKHGLLNREKDKIKLCWMESTLTLYEVYQWLDFCSILNVSFLNRSRQLTPVTALKDFTSHRYNLLLNVLFTPPPALLYWTWFKYGFVCYNRNWYYTKLFSDIATRDIRNRYMQAIIT